MSYYVMVDGDIILSTCNEEIENKLREKSDCFEKTENEDGTYDIYVYVSGSHHEDEDLVEVLTELGKNGYIIKAVLDYNGEGGGSKSRWNVDEEWWEDENEITFFPSDFKTKEDLMAFIEREIGNYYG